ncbi:coiled-coil domain-containing protein 89 isoform X2 [Nelusetta ayraudi]
MNSIQRSLEELHCSSAGGDKDVETKDELRSRLNEQSNLIRILKLKVDQLTLQCQSPQRVNTELKGQLVERQEEVDKERRRAELLERRFAQLASNNQGIISFMEEYKYQNAKLNLENKELLEENQTLFCKKVQEREAFIQKLLDDTKRMTDEFTKKENEYLEELTECHSKAMEQASEHQTKDEILLDQLHNAQKRQNDAKALCEDLKLKLQKAAEEQNVREFNSKEHIKNLSKERDELLYLSLERGNIVQEKEELIQQLEKKLKDEKEARMRAEDRFAEEAEAVRTDMKVMSLQSALDKSALKYSNFKKEFEAFKEHSNQVLTQERELNKRLRHLIY